MTPNQSQPEKDKIIDISSDASEAEEENQPEYDTDGEQNLKAKRWAIPQPLTPDSKLLKTGEYGMFSGSARSRLRLSRSLLGKRRHDGQVQSSPTKRHSALAHRHANSSGREESPLFEPEYSSPNRAGVLTSPSSSTTRRAENRALRGTKRFTQRARRGRAIVVEDLRSDTEPEEEYQSQGIGRSNQALENIRTIFESSPLPGNATLVREYQEVLQNMCAHYNTNITSSKTIAALRKEDADLAAAIENSPAQEAKDIEAVAQACAAAIQADMRSITLDMDAIEEAMNRRREEAKLGRQELMKLTQVNRECWERRRLEIAEQLAKAREELQTAASGEIAELHERKQRLEKEGGMALAFELGRNYEIMARGW
ncbi:hypothetical protein ACN47E_009890 [Coniothyrium glycines]